MEEKPKSPFNAEYDGRDLRVCGEFGKMPFLYFNWIRKSWTHRWLFKRIEKNWDQYWSGIYESSLEQIKAYDETNHFGEKPFEIRMNKSGGWIQDDVMFELHFFTPNGKYEFPIWVVAFKGKEVIHSQASY